MRLARWDGTAWTVPGTGIPDYPADMVTFDDGTGTALYVLTWNVINGTSTTLRRWNGITWTTVGNPGAVVGSAGTPVALTVWDGPQGRRLAMGGRLAAAGSSWVAQFNGTTWSGLGSGFASQFSGGMVLDLITFGSGAGGRLIASGDFITINGVPMTGLAAWDGTTWAPLGNFVGLATSNRYLAVADWSGQGNSLLVAGAFHGVGNLRSPLLASFDGMTWSGWYEGRGLNSESLVAAKCDDGTGSALFVGGSFRYAGPILTAGIAKWDGSDWAGVGALPTSGASTVYSIVQFDGVSGPAIYAGGYFNSMGGVAASNIARLSGASWSALGPPGSGVNGVVLDQAVFDDGTGPALYVAGAFTTAGGIPASNIARWDGSVWSAVGGGLTGSLSEVCTLRVHDDGTGPALYAGGRFTAAGGIPISNLARYRNGVWSPVGSASSYRVQALEVFDDGSGPALWMGCFAFSISDPIWLASWNGSSWIDRSLGLTQAGVKAFSVFDDGRGPRLFAAGDLRNGLSDGDIGVWTASGWQVQYSWLGANPKGLYADETADGPVLWCLGSLMPVEPNSPKADLARYRAQSSCLLSTQAGLGAPLQLSNAWTTPGAEVFNVFSLDPCPGIPGGGPYGGLCFVDPLVLAAQLTLPSGTLPFRPLPRGAAQSLGSYPLPSGLTFDCVSVELFPTGLGCISPVRRVLVR